MKFFQKTWVAVLITLAMVAGAVVIGQNREETVPNSPASVGLDTSLSTSRSEGFLLDEADVLSQEEERQINLYNANWLERYDSLVALALVPSVTGNIDDYAYDLAMDWELAAADAVLVINTGEGDAYLYNESGKKVRLEAKINSEDDLALVKRGIHDVIYSTDRSLASHFNNLPVEVAGKSGTGQKNNEDDYAWFCAYAPADDPKYVVAAVLEQGGGGSATASRAIRDVLGVIYDAPDTSSDSGNSAVR